MKSKAEHFLNGLASIILLIPGAAILLTAILFAIAALAVLVMLLVVVAAIYGMLYIINYDDAKKAEARQKQAEEDQ